MTLGHGHLTPRDVMVRCEREKALLDGSIEEIVEVRSRAEALRVYAAQRKLGEDAQLAIQELLRRAERGIGLAIRRGQEAGEIRKASETVYRPGHAGAVKRSPNEFASKFDLSNSNAGIYHLTDGVSDEQFERAVAEARRERNLSRVNVRRKITAQTRHLEKRSEFNRNRRRVDHYRVLEETITTLEGLSIGLRLVEVEEIPRQEREEWAARLREVVRPINRFAKEVTK